MWQVFLYLANERQVRERQDARATHRTRRWSLGRRASGTPTDPTRADAAAKGAAPRTH